MSIRWNWQTFDQLTTNQLYELLQLRCDVFVVEQHCAYQELDGKDRKSWHLQGYQGQRLVAYARVFVDEYKRTVIGRIVAARSHRGIGLGRELVEQSMMFVQAKSGTFPSPIYMMAQKQLELFYQSMGFQTVSSPYNEDGILHIDMEYHEQ